MEASIPENLFFIFNKNDNDKFEPKSVTLKEDDVIKITECLNTTFTQTMDKPNFQNLLSVYASTASILKGKYQYNLQVSEFLYIYGKYVNIMKTAVKNIQPQNGSKDYVR